MISIFLLCLVFTTLLAFALAGHGKGHGGGHGKGHGGGHGKGHGGGHGKGHGGGHGKGHGGGHGKGHGGGGHGKGHGGGKGHHGWRKSWHFMHVCYDFFHDYPWLKLAQT